MKEIGIAVLFGLVTGGVALLVLTIGGAGQRLLGGLV